MSEKIMPGLRIFECNDCKMEIRKGVLCVRNTESYYNYYPLRQILYFSIKSDVTPVTCFVQLAADKFQRFNFNDGIEAEKFVQSLADAIDALK